MKTINGFKYSKTKFDDYKFRLMLEIIDKDEEDHQITVYTTQTNLENALIDLKTMITDKVMGFHIFHSASKEQDDLATKFMEEFLNEN